MGLNPYNEVDFNEMVARWEAGKQDINNDGGINVIDIRMAAEFASGNANFATYSTNVLLSPEERGTSSAELDDYLYNFTSNALASDTNQNWTGDPFMGGDNGNGGGNGGGDFHEYDINKDGIVNILDITSADTTELKQLISDYLVTLQGDGADGGGDGGGDGGNVVINTDVTSVSGKQSVSASQMDLGISSGAVGSRKELSGMLSAYKTRTLNLQAPQRQKTSFVLDRFDGGINLNASPRDISYFEACQMDCLSPAKAGRLIRLGDFGAAGGSAKTGLMAENGEAIENYGLHYFKWSNEKDLGSSGTPTNYIAAWEATAADINIFDLGDNTVSADAVTSLNANAKPVFHNAGNRVYVSDASFASDATYMFGIVDRRKLFPFDSSGTLTYNITGDSHLFKNETLYHAAPTKGVGSGHIMVTGTQANETNAIGGQHVAGFSNTEGGTYPDGIYINVNFESIAGDEGTSIGWGSADSNDHASNVGPGTKYYKIYASFLYDNGSETKLTDVTSSDNAADSSDTIKATSGEQNQYQKMVIKQVLVDGVGIVSALPRVHGARFYYDEVNSSGNSIGSDKYLWAELDFRYGFKLASEFANWNQFEDDNGTSDGSTASDTQSIQVLGAANAGTTDDTGVGGDFGTLQVISPPRAHTYYTLNLFHQEEIKTDLMWKTSSVGNGIAFIGNIEYDGRQYPDTMLYSGAGETDAGSVYPMWGVFPVDSNRIDIPGAAGEITALKWTSGNILQFRKNAVYVINVENVLSPSVVATYQGMGVHGQWAVTETPFGCAWVNDTGCYAYNVKDGVARSLTLGRLDVEDWQGNSPHVNTKIGYDDRAKMLIVTNSTKYDTDGYHYAYSFVTNAWCTWNTNKGQADRVTTNFAIDHEGYLSGAVEDGTALDVYRWSAVPATAAAVDYITKDFDFGKPSLDKRFYTLYISFTGGASQSDLFVYFRANGLEGTDLASGWTKLATIYDYTDPYRVNQGNSWAADADDSTALKGDAHVPTAVDDLDSNDTDDVQKLAKINLRHLGTSTAMSDDYLKFARSIQFRIIGTAAITFEINDITMVYKEKRLK